MSGRLGDLSPKQAEALKQFRENLKDVLKPEHDDHYLLRWLRARKFDLNKSEAMLRKNLIWREQNEVDTILETYKVPEVIEKYYVGGLFGRDKEGSLIWIDPYGRIDLKGILRSVKKTDIIKSKICLLEAIYKKFAELTKQEGRIVDQLVIIFDLQYMGLKHLWKPGVDVLLEVLGMFEDYYPETLKLSLVVNAPRIFPIAFSLVRPILSEDTVRKIQVLGPNYKNILLKYIDADQLPAQWGGSYTDPDGDPRAVSHICFGGEIPSSYYCQELTNLDNFTEASVGRGSSLQLEFDIRVPKSLLRFQFKTDGFDVAFGVFYRKNKSRQKSVLEPVLASKRVNSHMVPEDGSVTCQRSGIYVVRFDNSYSWVRTKKLFYLIEVIAPDISDLAITASGSPKQVPGLNSKEQSFPTLSDPQSYIGDEDEDGPNGSGYGEPAKGF